MSTSLPKLKLYSYWRSSCSWRVRLALAMKGIEYEYEAVHLLQDGGKQNSEEYERLNPMHQVPALQVDENTVLVQSLPIIEYLEEEYPEPSLFPGNSLQRARIRALAELIGSGIQPVQNLSVLQYLGSERKLDWGNHFITKGFEALEKELNRDDIQFPSGKYCVGDVVTAADLFLVPQVYNANRFKVDMDKFPVIARIHDSLTELPEFEAAQPSNQPDAE